MRACLLALLILPALSPAARADDDGYDDTPALQRYLVNVQLGDSLDRVRWVYPPAQEWPATIEPRTGVTRYRVERGNAKAFPAHVETLYLGVKKGKLVEIEVVYSEKESRTLTVEKVAGDYALVYGEAKRSDDRFYWSDGKTVLRVFPAEIPIVKDGAHAVAWRTAVQVFDHGLAGRASQPTPE
jgi:hypothetical protein